MIRIKLGIFVIVFLWLFSVALNAQWDTSFTQFWMIKNSYNPSFAGASGSINASALNKRMNTKAENGPSIVHLTANMPFEFLGLNHGVGAVFANSKVGKEHNNYLAVQYSYNQRIGKSMLNAGVQLGYHEMNYDAASIFMRMDSTQGVKKEIVANPVDKKRVDINGGVSFTSSRFYVGIAARHINEPTYYSVSLHNEGDVMGNDSTLSKIPLSYNFIAAYNISLFNTLFELEPMVLYESNAYTNRLCAAMQLSWKQRYSIGGMWRKDDRYSLFASAAFSNVVVRYAYDQNKYYKGADFGSNHEVALQYVFDLDLFRPKPKPHKSIRLL